MYALRKLVFMLFVFLQSISVYADTNNVISALHDGNDGVWSLQTKTDKGYRLSYKNSKGVIYINDSIIDSELNESDFSLSKLSGEVISLVMNYPRDAYSFNFSSADAPHLLSACKQINLQAIDDDQAATVMVLCSKSSVLKSEDFSKLNAENLLGPNDLYLNGKVKVIIESERSFLFGDDNIQMKNRPYLIKGNVVDVLEYRNSMLKVKYLGGKRDVFGWIKFADVL